MQELLQDRRRVLVGVMALLAALALAGRTFLRPTHASVPPPVRVARAKAPAKPAAIYVDVVGAVRRPGLYRVRDGARVADAVARAGGVTPKAQLELVNLAARIADGEQVVVPRRGAAAALPAPGGSAEPRGPVHLNSATLEQLDSLPGVGPVTAQKILDYREQHGGFNSVDELDAVAGIGPARLADLRELVAP
ncbi:MAG TPA: helix-hairpin-helix domain-containing protein [Gaiellaceae bacterium]|nr:helix-hairpin-helix domain-containing protein [Gaiellaceae bacterium]HWJ44939.1 helix-hairpin-helix domain-containing protein [Gaiellaceae bacterium]